MIGNSGTMGEDRLRIRLSGMEENRWMNNSDPKQKALVLKEAGALWPNWQYVLKSKNESL